MERCRLDSVAECRLDTLAGCELVIAGYPRFTYNATGGCAPGECNPSAGGALELRIAHEQTTIPPLHWRTTRFLGLPLPPGLSIAIQPEALSGSVDAQSGEVTLHFCSRFRFQLSAAGVRIYEAADLLVDTQLTTERISSRRHQRQGRRLDGDSRGVLVGTALIQPCGEAWLDRFLGLPDEALAVLDCRLALP